MPEPSTPFASKSVPRHLARGSVGFGLLFGGIALAPVIGPAAFIASPLGLVALRGCPACWALGLAETVSQGRVRRQCEDGSCSLTKAAS
jgi:hypothetical protein